MRARAIWDLVLRPVLRFPRVAVALAGGVLVALALPLFGMHTSFLSGNDIPHQLQIVRTYTQIQHAFPGAPQPAQVVVSAADVDLAAVRRRSRGRSAGRWRAARQRADHDARQRRAHRGRDRHSAAGERAERGVDARAANAARAGAAGDARAARAASATRSAAWPPGTSDFNQTLSDHAPLVFAFVLGLAFVLLLITFRSIVIPLTSIVLNLLSVGAAYGVLVWVFQDGHLESLLGFHSNGAVVAWLPLFLFPVLFGLSMDYHVFIVSRIRELHDRGASTSEAVSRGIRATAGTVTAAAAVMVAVFAIFASLPTLDIKQLGVGLAVAVLIDATLIRSVLLPATMKLLGEWNWYLPQWLGWLPRDEPRTAAGHAASPSWREGRSRETLTALTAMAPPTDPRAQSLPAEERVPMPGSAQLGHAFAVQLWASTLTLAGLVLIWAFAGAGGFWPVWVFLPLALALAIHGWIQLLRRRPAIWRRSHMTFALALTGGIWVSLTPVQHRRLGRRAAVAASGPSGRRSPSLSRLRSRRAPSSSPPPPSSG